MASKTWKDLSLPYFLISFSCHLSFYLFIHMVFGDLGYILPTTLSYSQSFYYICVFVYVCEIYSTTADVHSFHYPLIKSTRGVYKTQNVLVVHVKSLNILIGRNSLLKQLYYIYISSCAGYLFSDLR